MKTCKKVWTGWALRMIRYDFERLTICKVVSNVAMDNKIGHIKSVIILKNLWFLCSVLSAMASCSSGDDGQGPTGVSELPKQPNDMVPEEAVSYTHLTLPTIYSV